MGRANNRQITMITGKHSLDGSALFSAKASVISDLFRTTNNSVYYYYYF